MQEVASIIERSRSSQRRVSTLQACLPMQQPLTVPLETIACGSKPVLRLRSTARGQIRTFKPAECVSKAGAKLGLIAS